MTLSLRTLSHSGLVNMCYLPHVKNVVHLAMDFIGVEDYVAVTSIEVAIRLQVHLSQLQVFYPPNLTKRIKICPAH